MSEPFELSIHAGKPYWMVGMLWVVLAAANTTDGRYSLMWQLCPQGSGPLPHHHDQDKSFFVLDGQITYQLGNEKLMASSGSFIWIPRGTARL
jgi:quercetin dioxygenase-like cupin family protein